MLAKDDSGFKFRTNDNLLTLRIRDNGDIEPYQRMISGNDTGLVLFAKDQTANIKVTDNDSIQLNGNIRLGHQGSLLTNVINMLNILTSGEVIILSSSRSREPLPMPPSWYPRKGRFPQIS